MKDENLSNLSNNKRINNLLTDILKKLKGFLEEQASNINELTSIGKAMSSEQNTAIILEKILMLALRFTGADGGTLYLISSDERELVFHVVYNNSLNIHIGGSSKNRGNIPNVSLYKDDGSLNLTNVSAYVANTGEIVNISDVYNAKGFNFQGTKSFDESLKYRSRSMLVIPMRDHDDNIIGVLQLINAIDPETREIIPFSPEVKDMASSLASQAAVMLTQQRLIHEMRELFESFIRAIATAIDEKSKYTGGHIQRVAELTMMIADTINESGDGYFSSVRFTEDELEELRIASWMHDTGKIVTPEHIIDKSSKLETLFDRIELIKTRWQVICLQKKLNAVNEKFQMVKENGNEAEFKKIDEKYSKEIKTLESYFNLINEINKGGEFLDQDKIKILNEISCMKYSDEQCEYPFLDSDELSNLCIRKGTLTPSERERINDHVKMTIKILEKLPWPKKLSNIPSIVGAHHEKLDGTGYPKGLKGENISMQARILAIADVFEALTAPDRPYKNPMPLSQALKIMDFMAKDNHIDENILKLFTAKEIYKNYAKKYLKESQIDI